MYTDEVEKLKKAWGDKPCTHPHFEREYHRGNYLTNYEDKKTDDWVCTQCGTVFTRAEKEAIETARENK